MPITVQQLINDLIENAPSMSAPVLTFDRLNEEWVNVTRMEFTGQGDEAEALVRHEAEDDDTGN